MTSRPKLQKLLLGESRVILIKKPIDQEDAVSFNETITDAFVQKSVQIYDIEPRKITKSLLLSRLSSEYSKTNQGTATRLSRFRQICARMSSLAEGVIYIYNAHSMSGTSLQLLSHLIRYVQQENLAWQFVLVADVKHRYFTRLNALGIDEYYPATIGQATDVGLLGAASSSYDVEQVSERLVSGSRIKFGLIAASLVCLALVGIFAIVNLESSSNMAPVLYIDDKPNIEPDFKSGNIKPSWDSELGDYLQELEAKNLDFELKLQSLKSQNATQIDSPTSIETVAQSPSAKQEKALKNNRPKPKAEVKAVAVPANYKTRRVEKRKPNDRVFDSRVISAITAGDLLATKSLLADSGDFHGRGRNGESALIIGVVAKQTDIVDFLLNNNLDTELVDNNGRTALYYAAIDGNIDLVKKLLDARADVNALTNLDKTPLMAAIHNGHAQTAKLLIAKGADVNVQDHSGWSSLFYAAWNGESELVSLLKAAGARIDLRDRDGYSLAQISKMKSETN